MSHDDTVQGRVVNTFNDSILEQYGWDLVTRKELSSGLNSKSIDQKRYRIASYLPFWLPNYH